MVKCTTIDGLRFFNFSSAKDSFIISFDNLKKNKKDEKNTKKYVYIPDNH